MNDTTRIDEMALSLKDFADKQLYDSIGSPQVAVSEVYGALQGAIFSGLMVNDVDVFNAQWKYAQDIHKYYFSEQFRVVVASSGGARMEFMDRDFAFLAGNVFVNNLAALGPNEAEILYGNAPDDLKKYAYDVLNLRFRSYIDELAQTSDSAPFDVIFPEPAGMKEFRVVYERKREERENQGDEGAIKN